MPVIFFTTSLPLLCTPCDKIFKLKAHIKSAFKQAGQNIEQCLSRRPVPKPAATTHVESITHPETSSPVQIPEDSQANPDSAILLEDLPAEIRRHPLFALEYERLKALVHASPVYHQQYLLDRQHLLSGYLERALGRNIIDAYIVYKSGSADSLKTRTEESVTQSLETYREHRFLSRNLILKTLELEEVLSLVTFYHSIMALARHYTDWAWDNLTKESNQQTHQALRILSIREGTACTCFQTRSPFPRMIKTGLGR